MKVINYIASYQGACLFLASYKKGKGSTVVIRNLPLFKNFLNQNKFKCLKTFPKTSNASVICWGSYCRDLFLINYLNQKKIFVTMYSASTLTNKLFYQKNLNTLNILPEFKTALKFFLNNIRYDFKKYEKRIFYCVPQNYIKKFVPFTKKNLNKKFLKFLKQKYQKKIQHLKKIRKKKILLIDANNKSLQEEKQKINNQHQIVIKNHPHSHLHKFSENVFVIPKEIPFEYCKSVFALKNIQIICFEKNSSLFSK